MASLSRYRVADETFISIAFIDVRLADLCE